MRRVLLSVLLLSACGRPVPTPVWIEIRDAGRAQVGLEMRDAEREGGQQADRDWAAGEPFWNVFDTLDRADVDVDQVYGIPVRFLGWCGTGGDRYHSEVARAYNDRIRILVQARGLPSNSLREWFLSEKELLREVRSRDLEVPWTALTEDRELWSALRNWQYPNLYSHTLVRLREPGR